MTDAAQTPAPPSDHEAWDIVLRPRTGWFDLHLRDLWRYRDLIVLFVRRDFVASFKQTILGPAWFIIQPLLTTIVFTIVFGNIAGLSTDRLPKMLFYLSGNVLWQFFANCLTATSNTFVGNAHLFGKVYFPRLAVPISVVISQAMKLLLHLALFLCFWLYFALFTPAPVRMNGAVALFPALAVIMAVLGLGCGIVISSATTKYRDLQFLVSFGVQLAMYATTVIYPLSAIKGGGMRLLILANPMTPIIEAFRYAFLGAGSFDWAYLAYSAAFALLLLAAGVLVFTKVEKTFMDTV